MVKGMETAREGKGMEAKERKGKEREKGRRMKFSRRLRHWLWGIDAPGSDDGDHGGDADANGGDDEDDDVDDDDADDGETLIPTVHMILSDLINRCHDSEIIDSALI